MVRKDTTPKKKRTRVNQTDVPSVELEKALTIPRALADNFASEPTTSINVAAAINIQPTSSNFRVMCGAAIAYGLTKGGSFAQVIEITELGKRILRPTSDGQDLIAKREAFLKPRILGEFLNKYNGSRVPREDIATNVLEDMGVPRERGPKTFTLIKEGAKSLGLLQEIKGQTYVNLDDTREKALETHPASQDPNEADFDSVSEAEDVKTSLPKDAVVETSKSTNFGKRKKRVFISHGKNKAFIEPISELLRFGELEPVVSSENQTVSQPVPDKVLIDMRSCGAAIIHVDAEQILKDGKGVEHASLNENVLIEIGAAMALYGRRFILLVKQGIDLPSNLQGLYEVRYEGDNLDSGATIALFKSISDIKNNSLPNEN